MRELAPATLIAIIMRYTVTDALFQVFTQGAEEALGGGNEARQNARRDQLR